MSYNKVMLIGNVGQSPSLSFSREGNQLEKANFSLATTEQHKTREGEKVQSTEWHRVVVWAPLANLVENFVKKGSQVFIEGKLTTRSFDKEGQKHFITEVHATKIVLLRNTGAEEQK
jgi:single-strand DNA-binding protein